MGVALSLARATRPRAALCLARSTDHTNTHTSHPSHVAHPSTPLPGLRLDPTGHFRFLHVFRFRNARCIACLYKIGVSTHLTLCATLKIESSSCFARNHQTFDLPKALCSLLTHARKSRGVNRRTCCSAASLLDCSCSIMCSISSSFSRRVAPPRRPRPSAPRLPSHTPRRLRPCSRRLCPRSRQD